MVKKKEDYKMAATTVQIRIDEATKKAPEYKSEVHKLLQK